MVNSISKRLAQAALLAVLLITVGCASLGAPVIAQRSEQGKWAIDMKASSYKFQPNNIMLSGPGVLTLTVENISDAAHNITINNPEGQELKSVNLPPKKTVSFTVDLPVPGKYEFHCNILFHTTLGMKGQIQVGS